MIFSRVKETGSRSVQPCAENYQDSAPVYSFKRRRESFLKEGRDFRWRYEDSFYEQSREKVFFSTNNDTTGET